jgi:hypothetical protein
MTAPVRLPHVSQGNLLTDVSTAAASLAGGLQAEQTKRREEAMRDAILKMQQQQSAATQQFQQGTARRAQLDDLRSKGIDIDPSQPGVQLAGDLTDVITEAQRQQAEISTDPSKPGAPRVIDVNGVRATVRPFYDPMNIRTLTAEQGRLAAEARFNAQQAGISGRQNQRLLEPTSVQTERAGLVRSLVQSSKQLNDMAAKDPTLGQRSGLIAMLSQVGPNAKADDAVAALLSRVGNDPQAQAYIAEMMNYISSFAFARGGKNLTANELSVLLPQAFGFGFETGPAGAQRKLIRQRLLDEAFTTLGDEGLVYALERGMIDPNDVPNFEALRARIQRFYGRDINIPPNVQQPKPHSRFLTPGAH